jgi:glycosyltransferase involved in cell wall biosynthesis
MSKVRIIHIQVLPILSGVQKAMLDVLVRLDRRKYDITVLCHSEGELTEVLRQKQIKYVILPELRREINPYFDLLAFLKLYRLFKKQKYDLVHTHSTKPGIVGRLAAKAAGVRCIVHTVQGFAFHERSSKMKVRVIALLEKIAGMACHKVIFVNNQDRIVATQLKIVPAYKMMTIYNGIDLSPYVNGNGTFNKRDLRGSEVVGPIVGMVARLWKQKAPQYFIQSIPTVLQEFPSAKFLVIGDGPLQSKLEKMCERLGIRKNVLFMGWRKDVLDLLKIMDVFVLSSLWEGLPISILEAMSASKPVVATDIKGNNELVVHGKTGFLVEPRNAKQIAESVLKLLRDRSLARRIGQSGFARVQQYFEISRTVEQVNDLYDSLLSKKSNSQTSFVPVKRILGEALV